MQPLIWHRPNHLTFWSEAYDYRKLWRHEQMPPKNRDLHPTRSIGEHHEIQDLFVVYDVRPNALWPVDKLLIIQERLHQNA